MFRVLRSAVSVLACIAGWSFAIVAVPSGTLLVLAVLGAAAGLIVQHVHDRARRWAGNRRESLLPAGCLGATTSVAVVGLVAGAGWGGGVLAGCVVLMWPTTAQVALDLLPATDLTRPVEAFLRRPTRRSHRALQNWPARLRTMSDGSVCYAWGISSERLKARPPATEQLAIVLNRAYLLDELERRDPAGFATWTTSGPALTVDPRRFINSTDRAERWEHPPGHRE